MVIEYIGERSSLSIIGEPPDKSPINAIECCERARAAVAAAYSQSEKRKKSSRPNACARRFRILAADE